MSILEYLKPDNPYAQWLVYALLGLFAVWLALLLWNTVNGLLYKEQIKRCQDVSRLLPRTAAARRLLEATAVPVSEQEGIKIYRGASPEPVPSLAEGLPELPSPAVDEKAFQSFLLRNGIKEDNPLTEHIRAIFYAGRNESQLDARGLIKNTSDRIFRANTLLRSLLSIFIILGLLGTLFGLADTMSSLDTLLHGTTQLNNDTLSQGLQRLLGTLRGAFAPSILGVTLTILGVLLLAAYLRLVAQPLGNLLERSTLTVWVPQLVPTASQKLLDKLQLSEQQMQRSFAAAQDVAKFAENIQHKTGAFGQTLDITTESLKQMAQIAERLGTFSENFVEGVKVLMPFQQDIRTLYQQMVQESRAFQESVQQNIAGAKDFQQRIQEQLNSQNQQLTQVLVTLKSYETAYIANTGQIDKQLSAVLVQAEAALRNLSLRNEEIGQVLDDILGKPLRADLTQHLSAVETALQSQLGKVESTLQVQLASLGERLRSLDAPLNTAAENFTQTFLNFNEHTNDWRTTLQREFVKQNETNQQQLQRLEVLSQQIPELLQQLSASSGKFTETSTSFAERGQQLSQDVGTLSQNISTLSESVNVLSEKLKSQQGGDDKASELLEQQARILQELVKIEKAITAQSRSRQVSIVGADGQGKSGNKGLDGQRRFRDRVLTWITFGRR